MNVIHFFSSRLNGQVPFKYIFVNDMLVIGTMINVIATSIALVVMIQTDNAILAVVLHAVPLPYNAFLVLAVWRASGHSSLAMTLAALWFFAMAII